jgi:hypothetical protein
MTAPALAEVRRREQIVDQFLVRQRRGVLHERIDRFRLRRESEQVIVQPLDERRPVRLH